MFPRRVVVTGLGLVTPLGSGVNFVWNKILQGASGITQLKSPAYEKLPCRVAGFVPTEGDAPGTVRLDKIFSDAERRSYSRATLFALVATEEAVLDSKLKAVFSEKFNEKIGVAVGMGLMDLQDVMDTGVTLIEKGYNHVSPHFILRALPNSAAGQISLSYGLKGPNQCASTACASGSHSIGDAFMMVRHDYADIMICGGAESSINPLTIASFCRLRALSTKYNDQPEKASRPFDSNRDGFVMGEGAGILVLEELNHAMNRGARIYGEVLGYGLSGDAFHMTAAKDDGDGPYRAMIQALGIARIPPQQLSYINCHATSTPIGDRAELRAILKLLGPQKVTSIALSSTKGSHGHLLGAAGAVESVITLLACQHKIAPPSINISELEEEFVNFNISRVADSSMKDQVNVIALKNSFGFGGTNTSLCFSNFPVDEDPLVSDH